MPRHCMSASSTIGIISINNELRLNIARKDTTVGFMRQAGFIDQTPALI